MNLGPQNPQTLKESFTVAVRQGDISLVRTILDLLRKEEITFTFMEQMVLLGKLSKLDPTVGRIILNCGVFRQELVLVGLTCLQDFKSNEPTPISVPLVERELIKAVEEKRIQDVELILMIARWCVPKVISKWASNKTMGVTDPYEECLAVEYMSKLYLPLQDMQARLLPRIIANSTSNTIEGEKSSRRITL